MDYLMEVDVLRMFKYCKISGTVIRRRALRNLSPRDDVMSNLYDLNPFRPAKKLNSVKLLVLFTDNNSNSNLEWHSNTILCLQDIHMSETNSVVFVT